MLYNMGYNSNASQSHLNNTNRYLNKLYTIEGSCPNSINNESAHADAYRKIGNLKELKTIINEEIDRYDEDLEKCNTIMETLSKIDSNMETISTNIVEAQRLLKNNFTLTTGFVPGLEEHQDASKNLLNALDLRNDIRSIIEKEKTDIAISKGNLNMIKTNSDTLISRIRRMIEIYISTRKS